MLIIDSHEDLAYAMLQFGRDYTRSAAETRLLEAGTPVPSYNGDTLLGWPDYQRGRVALVFSTLFAAPARARQGSWDTLAYESFEQAHTMYSAQLDVYYRLVETHPDHFRLVFDQRDLKVVMAPWQEQNAQGKFLSDIDEEERAGAARRQSDPDEQAPVKGNPVGLVVLMEGAEGVRSPGELEEWWRRGVRIISPAWTGTRYCGGSREPGPLTKEGFDLLEGMAELGFALDLSHMDQAAALQALERYPGAIIASHSNAMALLKGIDTNRHLPDSVLHSLLERDGVMGVVMENSFLVPGWKERDGRGSVTLHHIVAQIDYVCQMAGDARHVGLGSDFDGGFGLQKVPGEMDTIADLQKLVPLLADKGYSDQDIARIMALNWLAQLQRILPEEV